MIKNIKWLCLASLAIVACSKNDEVTPEVINSADGLPLTAGTANFSKYVALGNSLTAGYSDSALFIEGQKGAWTSVLAEQFKLVGGGEFKIPFMADNVGGLTVGPTVIQAQRLYWTGSAPAPVVGPPTTNVLNKLTGPFNNMGVPGAKSFHLLSKTYGNPAGIGTYANPYFVRFASSTTASVLEDAVAQSPTFFSLWIGNNDVLSYATTGGIGVNQITNFDPTTYGGNDITSPTVFAGVYSALLDGTNGLTKNGAKGVVSNIPYVTSVPFFTTVPTNPIPGSALTATQITDLNQLFGGINSALASLGQPKRFATLVGDDGNPTTTEVNPLLIIDETLINISAQITAALTPQFGAAGAAFLGNQYGRARHARNTAGDRDYILLTSQGLISPTPVGNNIQAGLPAGLTPTFAVRGVTFPLQDEAVLTADETLQVKTATDAYNATIKSLATAKGLAFVDANAVLNQVATTGVVANGYTVKSDYVLGGAFSLDGVHPSPRGYALIANEFIKEINKTYGSNLKAVDLGKYRVMFPKML